MMKKIMRIRGWLLLAVGVLTLSACETTVGSAGLPAVVEQAPEIGATPTLKQGEWIGHASGDRNGYVYTGYFCDSMDKSEFRAMVEGNRITGTIKSVIGGTMVPISWKFDGSQVTGMVVPLGYATPRKVSGRLEDGELKGVMVNAGSSTCSGKFVLRPVEK